MKICDKCYSLTGDSTPATEQIIFVISDERFDLCTSCSGEIRDFINGGGSFVAKKKRKRETTRNVKNKSA
jgi:hypothetical protein